MTSPKHALRHAASLKRDAFTSEDRSRWGQACCERLLEYIKSLPEKPKIIAGYAAIRSELNLVPLFTALEAGPYISALPTALEYSKELVFYRWNVAETLTKGLHGTYEPSREGAQVIPDILLVPLLAFDRSGHRLGYGGGYYDATLEALRQKNPSLLAIGAAFALQEVAALDAEPHDARLDMIATEIEMIAV